MNAVSFRKLDERRTALLDLVRAFNRLLKALEQAFTNGGDFVAATDGDATPSVGGGVRRLLITNEEATTVTALDEGRVGQEVEVHFGDSNTTIDFTGTTLKGNGGVDWNPGADDSMRCVKGSDGNWRCAVTEG